MTLPAIARGLIERLALVPHPEGGWFREVFRSRAGVQPADGRGERTALTVIHFLLAAGGHSRWHTVRSDEQWTFLEGNPLELLILAPDGPGTPDALRRITLGPLSAGLEPVAIVPAGAWQAARPLGSHALVACSVGPGFDFEDFLMLGDDPGARRRIEALGDEAARLL